MPDDIETLLHSIRAGGTAGDEAALIIGLLLERAVNPAREAQVTGEIRQVLGEQWAERRLSADEVTQAVEGLIDYLYGDMDPLAGAVWALDKSHDPRRREVFLSILDRVGGNPQREHLAHQALVGLSQCAGRMVDEALRRAAQAGSPGTRSAAAALLARNQQVSDDS